MDVYIGADLPRAWALWCNRLARGELAILPTDTIYGLSTNAWDARAVRRLGALKRRHRPSTVVPHSTAWARSLVAPKSRPLFDALWRTHAGETLLLPYGPDAGVPRPAAELTQSGLIGLRAPGHWITALARDAGVPLVTSSVNISGRPFMVGLDDIPRGWAGRLDFLVFEGPLERRPSPINMLERGRLRRRQR